MLPISEADKYDFRAGAFNQMLEFLEKNQKIRKRSDLSLSKQVGLFYPSLFIICGPTCAGKTTLAEFLVNKYNFYHLEASDFMYCRYFEHHGIGSKIRIGDFAQIALTNNPCIVADQIIQEVKNIPPASIVITGFRSPTEIDCFKQKYEGDAEIVNVFVDANSSIRFERSKVRNRDVNSKSLEKFNADDAQQEQMGIGEMREGHRGKIIFNEASKEEYFQKFTEMYAQELANIKYNHVSKSPQKNLKLEEAIILALLEEYTSNNYFTTTEIAKLISKHFPENVKNKNNVSRYFNQNFYPYYEINFYGGKNHYRLSQTGLAKANYLRQNLKLEFEKI